MLKSRRVVWMALVCVIPLFAAGGEVLTFDSAGTPISYTVTGAGDPVVLIHGFSANWRANWQAPGIIEALSEEHTVIALDCRGHGRSGKPHSSEEYGQEMAKDVVRLLDHLQIEKAQVVGYSMGAFISMKVAVLYPDRVKAVVPCGAGYIPRRDKRWRTLFMPLAKELPTRESFGRLVRYLRPEGSPPLSPEAVAAASRGLMGANDPEALAACMGALQRLVPTKRELRACQVPGLAIVGDRDPLADDVKALATIAPNVEIDFIPNGDHMTTFARPLFLEKLKDFLRIHAQAQ